jgi:uncharacterized protein YjaG (DUF416 family)
MYICNISVSHTRLDVTRLDSAVCSQHEIKLATITTHRSCSDGGGPNADEANGNFSDVKKEYGVKWKVDRKNGQESRPTKTCKRLRKSLQLLLNC